MLLECNNSAINVEKEERKFILYTGIKYFQFSIKKITFANVY